MPFLLLLSVLVVATCGLIYELVAGTLATYLLGDSVTQFSLTIGIYLFSMGIGSFISKYINKNLLAWFVQIEMLVGVVGGISSSVLFISFEYVSSFQILLYFFVVSTGVLVGLEIPLIMRILKEKLEFKDLVSKVFTFDYAGALLASVVFPLLLVPYLGLIKTSFLFGMFNVSIAWLLCHLYQKELPWMKYFKMQAIVITLLLLAGFVYADRIMNYAESVSYHDHVVFSKSSPYQRIVITKSKNDVRLFLNGNLQFSSKDEYRYHEALVHPVMQAAVNKANILVLGGGDGMAVREILKYKEVESVTLVDLDKEITSMFSKNQYLLALNDSALLSEKVKVYNEDAFVWLKNKKEKLYDVVIIDFPDPSNYSVGKLYSTAFYKILHQNMNPQGLAVIQSTSPFVAPRSFWCINNTIQQTGFITTPYHAYVPSFGEWGYIVAGRTGPFKPASEYMKQLKFINHETMAQMLYFPRDMRSEEQAVNKLQNQILVQYFEKEWSEYVQH